MSGKIKTLIDEIVVKRSNGDPLFERTTKLKIQLKGINIERYNASSDDDPIVIAKLNKIAEEFGLTVGSN